MDESYSDLSTRELRLILVALETMWSTRVHKVDAYPKLAREWNVTNERVRQIHSRLMGRIRRELYLRENKR